MTFDWSQCAPLANSSIPLHHEHRGKPLFQLIVDEHPDHGLHFVRRITRRWGTVAPLTVECSCGVTYQIE